MNAELDMLIRQFAAERGLKRALEPEAERVLVASLRAALGPELSVAAAGQPAPATAAARSPADLMTVHEAAEVLSLSPRWLYRHAKTLPFTRKLSRKVLRFSRAGLHRWLATKRP